MICNIISNLLSDGIIEQVFSNSSLVTDLELLSVKALQVIEGDNALITIANLHLVLDYHKYGIRESGILFHVVEPPMHGSLYVDIWPRKSNMFTMLDLSRDKVSLELIHIYYGNCYQYVYI